MKKNLLLLSAAFACAAGAASAQGVAGDAGTLTALLREGVTANATFNERDYAEKNIVVAGSEEKGYLAYFCADDGVHGEELWATDGTPDGTYMVKDIYEGISTSNILWLTRFNDKVIFSATGDSQDGQEIWISDGTADGTYMVANVNEWGDSEPRGLCQLNENQFVFFAKDDNAATVGTNGQWWLYVSDGTAEGTTLVKEVNSMFPGREPIDNRTGDVVRVGRKVFFIADVANVNDDEVTYGDEVWVTDGTPEGTKMIKDINTEKDPAGLEGSTRGAAIAHFLNFYNKKLFFKAWSWASGNEPWAYDLETEEAYEIFNTNDTFNPDNTDDAGVPMGSGGGVTKTGYPAFGHVFFRSSTPSTGSELGMTNCEKGNYKIFDISTNINVNNGNTWPDDGVEFDGKYVFCCNRGMNPDIDDPENPQLGGELNICDGEKVWLQYDFAPGTGATWTRELTVCNGTLYYWNSSNARDGHAGRLVRVDGLDATPVEVTNIDPTNDGVHMLRNLDGKLIFISDADHNIYCYEYDNPDKKPSNRDTMLLDFGDGAGIDEVVSDFSNDGPVEYFNLQGMRVNANTPGLYIRREGNKASKVILK